MNAQEIRDLSDDAILDAIEDQKLAIFNLRFQRATGQLEDTNAIRKAPADRNAEEAAAIKISDELVAELQAADKIVIGTGLINFNIYSGLKSWIDNVARAGVTFSYSADGPKGHLTGKKAYIVLASAGVYSEGPAAPLNHAVPYLKTVLGFLGITDVEVLNVEGLAFGPDAVAKALAAAESRTKELAVAA